VSETKTREGVVVSDKMTKTRVVLIERVYRHPRYERVVRRTKRLKALEPAWVTNRQIEAARVSLTRSVQRGGKVFIRIFPDKPVTKKPAETRMGKGKGNPEFWVAVVKPGRILYEMEGVDEATAKDGFRLAAQKLGIKTKFVTRTRAL